MRVEYNLAAMQPPVKLARPPIIEALVDIRAVITQPQEVLTSLAEEFKGEFPKHNISRSISAKIEIREGKLVPPTMDAGGFRGVQLFNEAGNLSLQFRLDGFTFNNLSPYIGGNELVESALRYWEQFVQRTHPTGVTRIAMRYINRLDLPFGHNDLFERFLNAAPDLPEPAPQGISEFHTRVVAHDLPVTYLKSPPTAIITQQLNNSEGRPVVIIDVDCFKMGDFAVSGSELRTEFEELREFKNRTFFSLLTEETVKLYL